MEDRQQYKTEELAQSLAIYFDVDKEITYETLLAKLTGEIQLLIDHHLDRLWALLYRIDVSEKKVRDMLATTSFSQHATRIAQLIIERQQQKIESRKKYRR